MKIKKLHIGNYKSINEINIDNPNPFSVFVGPNAAGKSNIFDALEFYNTLSKSSYSDTIRLFDDISHYKNITNKGSSRHSFKVNFSDMQSDMNFIRESNGTMTAGSSGFLNDGFNKKYYEDNKLPLYWESKSYLQFFSNFSRIFVGNKNLEKFQFKDDKKLSLSCDNLEQVLKRVLSDQNKNDEISEWLEVLIPGFKSLEVKTEELSGSSNLVVYEKDIEKPLTRRIISDGTFNTISILTALYQTDEPQFLCIEEPENGLNPKVVKELVSIFRKMCKEKGHYIWLNTHSQSLVAELTKEEIIIVDKIKGETHIKQIQNMDLKGLKMDEALLTNAIGGGIPW